MTGEEIFVETQAILTCGELNMEDGNGFISG